MIYLLLSILFNSALFIILKYYEKFKVNNLQAIVVNYLTACALGLYNTGSFASIASVPHLKWAGVAVLMGSLFICVFMLLAKTAQNIGISVATVANKMSVVIPVAVAVLYYHNSLGPIKIMGIVIALVAVFLTSKKERQPGNGRNWKMFFLPVIVFLGSGVIDALVNYAQEKLILPTESNLFIATGFSVAGTIGICFVLFRMVFRNESFQLKSLVWGIVLGVPNYLSIRCLIEALNTHVAESSVMYPLNNLGIVILCAGSSFLLFREKFSRWNILGIGLSLIAILLIAYREPV